MIHRYFGFAGLNNNQPAIVLANTPVPIIIMRADNNNISFVFLRTHPTTPH